MLNNNENTNTEALKAILQIVVVEWNQTIDEAKLTLEGEKEIIKHTILVTLTCFASILYFLSTNNFNTYQKLALSPLFIVIPVIYLLLSIYSFYQTFYRFMISRYWLGDLFPKIEKLLSSVPAIKQEIDKVFPMGELPFHVVRWQSFYRSKTSMIAIMAYRSIPLLLGLPISIAYFVFLINYRRSNIDLYVPLCVQLTLSSVILVCFIGLQCILWYGIWSMFKQNKRQN